MTVPVVGRSAEPVDSSSPDAVALAASVGRMRMRSLVALGTISSAIRRGVAAVAAGWGMAEGVVVRGVVDRPRLTGGEGRRSGKGADTMNAISLVEKRRGEWRGIQEIEREWGDGEEVVKEQPATRQSDVVRIGAGDEN